MLMKSFKDFIKEDGAAAGMSAGPTNVVGGGAIAGTGGKGGEPGVNLKKKKNYKRKTKDLRSLK